MFYAALRRIFPALQRCHSAEPKTRPVPGKISGQKRGDRALCERQSMQLEPQPSPLSKPAHDEAVETLGELGGLGGQFTVEHTGLIEH